MVCDKEELCVGLFLLYVVEEPLQTAGIGIHCLVELGSIVCIKDLSDLSVVSCVVYATVHYDDVKLLILIAVKLCIKPLSLIVAADEACLCAAYGCIGNDRAGAVSDSARPCSAGTEGRYAVARAVADRVAHKEHLLVLEGAGALDGAGKSNIVHLHIGSSVERLVKCCELDSVIINACSAYDTNVTCTGTNSVRVNTESIADNVVLNHIVLVNGGGALSVSILKSEVIALIKSCSTEVNDVAFLNGDHGSGAVSAGCDLSIACIRSSLKYLIRLRENIRELVGFGGSCTDNVYIDLVSIHVSIVIRSLEGLVLGNESIIVEELCGCHSYRCGIRGNSPFNDLGAGLKLVNLLTISILDLLDKSCAFCVIYCQIVALTCHNGTEGKNVAGLNFDLARAIIVCIVLGVSVRSRLGSTALNFGQNVKVCKICRTCHKRHHRDEHCKHKQKTDLFCEKLFHCCLLFWHIAFDVNLLYHVKYDLSTLFDKNKMMTEVIILLYKFSFLFSWQ